MSESDTTARRPDEAGSTLIDEIIRMSDFTFDRLPMLDIIGDRMVENLSVALPDLMRAMCEASLASLDYIPMGKVIE
ncbi:MAG: flagellar motor switch protein FliM, partial [Sulfitobacter sp.]|nr:flagellar motor switch protein FliM [Sulfitobacter sp.]